MKPRLSRFLILGLLLGSFVLIGCDNSKSANKSSEKDNTAEKKLPNLKLHKPKTFELAVARLREMHSVVKGEDEIPAPKVFNVIEIIHGEGAGAHSHYHLDDGTEHTHDDDDDHAETSKELKHEVQVDFFTELNDVIRWLPDVASDGDMNEKDWNSVKTITKSLMDQVKEGIGKSSDAEKRKSLQGIAGELDSEIQKLEKLVAAG